MISSMIDNTGRFAIITGACGLLGQEHARALLEINTDVVLTDIDIHSGKALCSTLRGEFPDRQIVYFDMDITSETSIELTINQLSSQGIEIDILINNAALDPKVSGKKGLENGSRLENFSVSSFEKEVDVGLIGAILCCKHFGRQMAERGFGIILNVASDLSVIAPNQSIYRQHGVPKVGQPMKPVSYSVIKAGMIGLTRYISTYWAEQGVRCNAVSPGGVENGQSSDFIKNLSKLIPLGRMAQKHEYRGVIKFTCSDMSTYMTGQNIVVDGGRSVW